MKQLDIAPLERLQGFLEQVDTGDMVIRCTLAAFSLRLQGLDKKLSKSLEEEVMASSSPMELARSPVGPLSESGSRKTLVSMILVLNCVYPDYDFTLLRASNFERQESLSVVEEAIDAHLIDVSKVWETTPGYMEEEPFIDALWRVLDESCGLKDCDVFTYKDPEPFEEAEGSLWSLNFFFVNRKEKQVLFMAATGISKSAIENSETTYARYNDNSDDDSDDYNRNDEVAHSMANEMDDLE